MRDLQRYTLIPVGQDEPDAYLELDPNGPWVLYRDVALSTPAHSVTPDPHAARETLRPDPLAPDHHDISWFGASGDVACIHDAEREGCTGCAHDADLRTTTHADTSGLPETALAAATERPLDVADHKHPRHEWRGHSSHMHEHHGDNIVWFPEAPTATPEAEDA